MNGRLAAGELNGGAWHGVQLAKHLQLMNRLIVSELAYAAGHAGVGEADGAVHVAAVGQVDLCEACGGDVLVAQPAVGGTVLAAGHVGVFQARAFLVAPPGGLGIKQRVGIDAVAHVAVVWAGLFDVDRAILNEVSPEDYR